MDVPAGSLDRGSAFSRTHSGTTCDSWSGREGLGLFLQEGSRELDRCGGGDPEISLRGAMRQKERTLVEYLSHAEEIRSQVSLEKREKLFVETFLTGLESSDIRARIEEQMRDAGHCWAALMAVVQDIIRESPQNIAGPKQSPTKLVGEGSIATARGENGTATRHEPKRRRRISIVPADADDVPFMVYVRSWTSLE
ncbi:hypothetical protein P175DRAFT_0535908 [Aspergillus ochraceoroseus IBT 24754]|uniref:Uncharacterized protein n=1 Tax=Aspergillus ochraceoroseus IBT 24754 TaxID=1392256 RepID=A0A2T5LMS0_9EURO|nr:uncharacterized protein P175DRAFT_0535908 [Aspergillus ochraceoroseus IBT 24754]PTU17573.1 hypothetical protein P175DRAFT_0535908 [Aspergillus ochraceoroseus IBT 24754]